MTELVTQQERVAAAKLRIALDKRLGYETEEWITDIASGKED
jgi:hypothetical protein